MTDFLTRLAERTLGLTPRVEPLLASRFAAAPATPASFETLDETQASPIQASTDPPQPGRTSSSRERPTLPNSGSVERPGPERVRAGDDSNGIIGSEPGAASETLATSGTRQSMIPPTLTPVARTGILGLEQLRFHEVSEPQADPPSIASAVSPSPPAELTTGIAIATSSAESSSSIVRPAEVPLNGPSHDVPQQLGEKLDRREEPAPNGPLPAPSHPDAIEPAIQSAGQYAASHTVPVPPAASSSASMKPAADGRRVLLRPLVERAAPHAAAVRPRPATTADEGERIPRENESQPTIVRVTIGRVEVRAVPPPTPPAARPAPPWTPPVLSLDDYLKQGGEAKR